MDQLWPNYLEAGRSALMDLDQLQSEFVVAGRSQAQERIVVTAYSKPDAERPVHVVQLVGGIAAPGQPLREVPDSFEPGAIRAAGRRQADYINAEAGREVACGRVIAALLKRGEVIVRDLAAI